jgi:hypothetical protein
MKIKIIILDLFPSKIVNNQLNGFEINPKSILIYIKET